MLFPTPASKTPDFQLFSRLFSLFHGRFSHSKPLDCCLFRKYIMNFLKLSLAKKPLTVGFKSDLDQIN